MSTLAQIQAGHLQKPSEQVPQDHPQPFPALLTCSRASGSLRELPQPRVSSATSRAHACSNSTESWLPNPGGSSQTPDSCPRLLICPPHRPGEPPPTPRPAPSGCPVNTVISHTHLDSCESGPPHPSWPAPNASCCLPGSQGLSWVFLCGLRFDGWVLKLSASWQVCRSSWMLPSCLCPSSLWPGSSLLAPRDTGPSLFSPCLP